MVGTETPKRTANFPQRDHPVLIRQNTVTAGWFTPSLMEAFVHILLT